MKQNIYSYINCTNSEARFYFFHIPKTAGTSLTSLLEKAFEPDEICPAHLWHQIITYDQDKLASFRLFKGHFYSKLNRIVEGPLKSFVFLRDPLERALSHYGHVVRFTDHYLHDRAIKLGSLKNYLLDPETRETVRNFHAKCLVGNFEPLEIASKLSNVELARFALERAIETTALNLSDAELLEQAKRALNKFCCIGITEKFEDSVKILNRTFGWCLDESPKALNTNEDRLTFSQITKEEQNLLLQLNSVDIELYQYALSLFESQMRLHLKSEGSSINFISYAQNFEDVMLWRALQHVEKGFYIDVGANDPTTDSVTKAFYERGWHGINIEPLTSHYLDLNRERPHDINLQCAAGAGTGEIEVWECDVRGWATASPDIIAQHTNNGHKGAFHKVPLFPLKDICANHVRGEIHFLKIDVEGFEKSVIASMDFSRFRPWILIIEATRPNSTEEVHWEWESLVLSANYTFAYSDGLNRFYVANEHPELLEAFRYPPNVFDNFIRSEQLSSELRAQQAEARAQQAEARAQQAEARAQQVEAKAQQVEAKAQLAETRAIQAEDRAAQSELRAIDAEARANRAESHINSLLNSSSWAITAPLRYLASRIRLLAPRNLKQNVKLTLQHSALYINRRPWLKNSILRVLNQLPRLKNRLISVALSTPVAITPPTRIPAHPAQLTPRANQIYKALKSAIEAKKEQA